MESVWVLCGRVVSPDDDVLNLVQGGACLFRKLAQSSALVESGQGGKVCFGNRRSIVGAD